MVLTAPGMSLADVYRFNSAIPGRPVRIAEDEHAHQGSAEPGHRDEALPVPDRARGCHRPAQEPIPLIRVILRIGIRTVKTRPRTPADWRIGPR